MTDRVLITFHLTREERDLLDALAGTGQRSKFLRGLILEEGKRAGLELPNQRLPERGKYIRK